MVALSRRYHGSKFPCPQVLELRFPPGLTAMREAPIKYWATKLQSLMSFASFMSLIHAPGQPNHQRTILSNLPRPQPVNLQPTVEP